MDIGIVGAGISGVICAIMLKQKNKNLNVILIDVNQKIGKKFLVTGNGRCNLGNKVITDFSYNNQKAKEIVNNFNFEKEIEFLSSIGIEVSYNDNLIYPFSNSAKALNDYLTKYAKSLSIKTLLNINVIDYFLEKDNKITVKTETRPYRFDRIILASGGFSQIINHEFDLSKVYKNHKYIINELKPGLTPIITNESTKEVEKLHLKCEVSLDIDSKKYYEEKGEVIFKKDGISGICIFNISSLISRLPKFKKATIYLDLMPNLHASEIQELLYRNNNLLNKVSSLEGLFDPNIAEYIRKRSGVKNLYNFTKTEIRALASTIKYLKFEYKSSYGFTDSQVTLGGLSFENFNDDLSSKVENNVYAIGEVLDADGLCGGYNIMFAFASANLVAEAISKLA